MCVYIYSIVEQGLNQLQEPSHMCVVLRFRSGIGKKRTNGVVIIYAMLGWFAEETPELKLIGCHDDCLTGPRRWCLTAMSVLGTF